MISIIIYVLIIASFIWGYNRGAVRQIGSIVAIVVAFLVSRLYGGAAAELFAQWMGADEPGASSMTMLSAEILGRLSLFIAVWFVIGLLARLLHATLNAIFLGWVNSLLGGAVMALKACLVMSLLLNLWLVVNPSASVGSGASRWVVDLLPTLTGAIAN